MELNLQLSMQQVSKSFMQSGVMNDIFCDNSISFDCGRSYAIMGPSGSGKSTAIHLLAGIDVPTSGAILYDNQPILSQKAAQQAEFFCSSISLVFQQPCLFAELTVLENVMIKAILAGRLTSESYQHAQNLLAEVGLAEKKDAFPAELSGGQQQRVALLRAIFMPPKFLLVDEPTGNLDEQTAHQVIDLLLHYQKKYQMGLIMSTHQQQIAARMEQIVHVQDKKLVFASTL